jgi:hypothetical protein
MHDHRQLWVLPVGRVAVRLHPDRDTERRPSRDVLDRLFEFNDRFELSRGRFPCAERAHVLGGAVMKVWLLYIWLVVRFMIDYAAPLARLLRDVFADGKLTVEEGSAIVVALWPSDDEGNPQVFAIPFVQGDKVSERKPS